MLTTMFIPIKPALKVKPEISALDGFKPTMRPKIMIIIGIPTVEPKSKNQCMACTNIFTTPLIQSVFLQYLICLINIRC